MPEIKRASTGKAQIIHREPIEISMSKEELASFEWIQSPKKHPSQRLFSNIAIATALLICVTALRVANDQPQAQSVFQSVKDSVNLNLDETLGKLSFVSNLLPETALVFWNDNASVQVLAPVEGDIIHVWNVSEPYITMKSVVNQVRCVQDGEVMSISHGNDEELIVRVRHNNNLESIYGNLQTVFVGEGEAVYQEDLIGDVIPGTDLAFELRQDGRSIDPTYSMRLTP